MSEEFIGRLVFSAILGFAWVYHHRKIRRQEDALQELQLKMKEFGCSLGALQREVWHFRRKSYRLSVLENRVNGVIPIRTINGVQKVRKNPCDLEQPVEEV